VRKILVFAALAVLPSLAAAQGDEAAIRKVSADFLAAWNKDDAKAMAATFAPDADAINPSGRVAKGRAEIEKLFTDEHAGPFKATTYTAANMSVRILAPTVATEDWDAAIDGMHDPSGKALPTFKHHVALVFVKKAGGWLVVSARPYAFLPAPPK